MLSFSTFFFAPKISAGTCDYPSVCDTSWSQSHDAAPNVGSDCNIPNVTTPKQYRYGTSNTFCGFGNSKVPCVPRCGFLGSGFCCDPINKNKPVTPTPSTPILPPCAKPGPNGTCAQVTTGIGVLTTDVGGLTSTIFKILLSLSGGIAVLLIIAAGYQMVTSQGNPEKVKEARERLTAAIIGLLFIIFSVTILQIIGVDILGLPGFGK